MKLVLAEATPRKPRRARGRARFANLLDAVDEILRDRSDIEISLQDVAARAGVPLASIYHYFPNNRAMLLELANRYLSTFLDLAAQPMKHESLGHWTDICRIHAQRSQKFYRENPVAMRLLLGPETGWPIRRADIAVTSQLGEIHYWTHRRHFKIAEDARLPSVFGNSISITDSILALSYAQYGQITPELAEEAMRARLSYLRLYIAELTEKRSEPLPLSVRMLSGPTNDPSRADSHRNLGG